jgi:hypothetical protein
MVAKPMSARTAERLKDEVYRQMLRVEAGHSTAQLALALALLRAWIRLDDHHPQSETRQWLRTICPVCLPMLERSLADSTVGCLPPDQT